MSQDIRSFFSVVSKKAGSEKTKNIDLKPKKIKALVDSDEEDVIQQTPEKTPSKSFSKRKIQVISSDSEEEREKKKKSSPRKSKVDGEKLNPVNIGDIFNDKPIKQSKVNPPKVEPSLTQEKHKEKKSKRKKKSNTEIGIHGDENFEKTLLELDDDVLLDNVDILDKTVDEALHKTEETKGISKENTPREKKEKKRSRNDSEGSTPKKPKLELTDSGIDADQESFEKRRYSAMLYQKYKTRGGPKHHGEKDIPKGKPNCLAHLTFIRTGVLDSLESDEFENLVKEHGGRIVHSISKKVNYIVVGDDPGPSKLDKARGLNIPEISEDDLLDMILVKSGMKPKFSKAISDISIESGISTGDDLLVQEHHKEGKHKEEKVKSKPKEEIATDIKLTISSSKDKKVIEEKVKSEPKDKNESAVTNKASSKDKKTDKINFKNLTNSNNELMQHNKNEEKIEKTCEIVPKAEKLKQNNVIEKNKKPDIAQSDTKLNREPKKFVPENEMSWTEKYKPKDIKSIIGQQDPSSNMNKLKKWLMNWYRNQLPEVRKKIPRPSPWAKNEDGAYFKAVLLSGPPGVGKTTTATLLSKELGFDIVEFNASDTRSKRLLHEEVGQLLSTTTIAGYATGQETTTKKRVLLMDEVDGMAGNEDRGGIQELIGLIKTTSVPIICMCNDRNHQKMRSLVNYCFDLKFNKPKLEQIRGTMMSICFKEGVKISPNALTEIINGTGCDVRQTLNHLAMWTAADKNMSVETAAKESKAAKKDTVMGPWEVIRAVFTDTEQKNMSLADKFKLFFYDYSIGPLFVQENYVNVTPNCSSKEVMKRAALAADAISRSDLIDSKIRRSNNWSLLETHGLYASVLPGYYMSGKITKRINFPGWLGKNSSANKHKRMLSELHVHTRTSTTGSRLAMKLDYLKPLRDAIINPLKKYGTEGVHQAIDVMKSYTLLRDDLTNLLELCQWKDMVNPFNNIDAKVKSAFTRAYNKQGPLLPFASGAGVSKKKSANVESDFLDEGEQFVESDNEEVEDDVTADEMIKVKAKTESKNKKSTAKAGTSKAKDSGKGSKGKPKKAK